MWIAETLSGWQKYQQNFHKKQAVGRHECSPGLTLTLCAHPARKTNYSVHVSIITTPHTGLNEVPHPAIFHFGKNLNSTWLTKTFTSFFIKFIHVFLLVQHQPYKNFWDVHILYTYSHDSLKRPGHRLSFSALECFYYVSKATMSSLFSPYEKGGKIRPHLPSKFLIK